MEIIGKIYTLKNGYKVAKCQCYDGYNMQYFWGAFNADMSICKHCGSYDEAYAMAHFGDFTF